MCSSFFFLRAAQALLELGRVLRTLFVVFLCRHQLLGELGELALDDEHVAVATMDRLFERDNFFLVAVRRFAHQGDELARKRRAPPAAAYLLELLFEALGEVFELGEALWRYVSGLRLRRSQELGCFFVNLVEDRRGFGIEKLCERWIDIRVATFRFLGGWLGVEWFVEVELTGLGFRRSLCLFGRGVRFSLRDLVACVACLGRRETPRLENLGESFVSQFAFVEVSRRVDAELLVELHVGFRDRRGRQHDRHVALGILDLGEQREAFFVR